MKVLYLALPLLSSLVIAQSLVQDDCQCPQVKCRATNAFESCRCINQSELECKKRCPNYVPTKWKVCSLPQQEVTSAASTPSASTPTGALPLPIDPFLGLPIPVLPVPLPKPLVLPLPDVPLVPGCECEQTFCILSFPEGCHCQWNNKKACYDKCGGTSPGINTCPALPALPAPVQSVPAPVLPNPAPVQPKPAPTPLVLPLPDVPLVPGCECEEKFCIMSFPEGCHCQWNNRKECYDKCGGTSPGINTCPALPAPVEPDPVLSDPFLPGPVQSDPVLSDPFLPGPTSPDPVLPDPALPDPTAQVSPLPDLPLVPGCECEQMMCIQSFPESCHCAWGIAKNCYDKCGGKSPGINTCPPKGSFGGGVIDDGPVKRAAVPEAQYSTTTAGIISSVVSGLAGASGTKACDYEEMFCAQVWPESCHCANANKYARYTLCGGAVPVYQNCPKPVKPVTIKTKTVTVTTTITPTPTPTPTPTGNLHKVQICGGGRGNQNQACPTGYTCVNDPYANQTCGLECDRTGICVEQRLCGGFAGFPCRTPGQVCLDDPRDDCSPKTGGADCGGLCFWPPSLREDA